MGVVVGVGVRRRSCLVTPASVSSVKAIMRSTMVARASR